MVTTESVARFLAQPRITVVGASDAKDNFGGAIYRALKAHGHDVVAVNPKAQQVDGDPCYPSLASVPGSLGGVLVMVNAADAVGVVLECASFQVRDIWLFKGLGGPGAVSDEAIDLCHQAGVNVVEGACPMMFLEPVGVAHRIHRGLRRLNGSLKLVEASEPKSAA
jgi:predicted CoA-binding protein